MLFAFDPETNQRIQAYRIPGQKKAMRALCDLCGAEVLAKCGQERIPHWAHLTKTDCPGSKPMTAWHWKLQHQFLERNQEVPLKELGLKADVQFNDGTVIEFQHSNIRPEEIAKREQGYDRMFWFLDLRKRVRRIKLTPGLDETICGVPIIKTMLNLQLGQPEAFSVKRERVEITVTYMKTGREKKDRPVEYMGNFFCKVHQYLRTLHDELSQDERSTPLNKVEQLPVGHPLCEHRIALMIENNRRLICDLDLYGLYSPFHRYVQVQQEWRDSDLCTKLKPNVISGRDAFLSHNAIYGTPDGSFGFKKFSFGCLAGVMVRLEWRKPLQMFRCMTKPAILDLGHEAFYVFCPLGIKFARETETAFAVDRDALLSRLQWWCKCDDPPWGKYWQQ